MGFWGNCFKGLALLEEHPSIHSALDVDVVAGTSALIVEGYLGGL